MRWLPTLICSLAAGQFSSAAIITTGDFQTGATPPRLTITAPFDLQVTSAGGLGFLVLEDWVSVPDGTSTQIGSIPFGPYSTLSYRINGGATQTTNVILLVDNHTRTDIDITAGDGYLAFEDFPVGAGDTVTFLPGTIEFGWNPDFNPLIPANFDGQVFGAISTGAAMTQPATVPEPSALMACALSLMALLTRRRAR